MRAKFTCITILHSMGGLRTARNTPMTVPSAISTNCTSRELGVLARSNARTQTALQMTMKLCAALI